MQIESLKSKTNYGIVIKIQDDCAEIQGLTNVFVAEILHIAPLNIKGIVLAIKKNGNYIIALPNNSFKVNYNDLVYKTNKKNFANFTGEK